MLIFQCIKPSKMGFVTHFNGKPLTASRKKILTIISLAVTCFAVAAVTILIDPIIAIAKYRTRIAVNSSIHLLLQDTLEAVHISAYLFNVTNAEMFLSGEDQKLKVEEVGPFTYRELRTNEDLELDESAGIVRYSPVINPVFLPEASIADPRDVNVTMPNIAMMTLVSMMSDYSYFTRSTFNMLISQLGSKAIVTMDAHNYLWGYRDSLITMGNTFMPGWITFDTMGLMDRMYDKKVDYRLEVGATNEDKFMIKQMNGCPGLKVWKYDEPSKRSKCNTFEDVYEGIGYPPSLTSETPIRIFRNVMCRMLELDYKETKTMEYGARAMVYKISNRTFTNSEDKNCTCGKKCINGVSDLSPCFYGLPLVLSNAHFLYGDPHFFERIEGLSPDEKKHGSEFLIEPKIGAALATTFSVQVNIMVGDVSFNQQAKRFADMVLPIGYFKIVQPELPEKNKADLRLIYITGPYVVLSIQVILFFTGTSLVFYAGRLLYWNWVCQEGRGIAFQIPEEGKKIPCDVEVPLVIGFKT